MEKMVGMVTHAYGACRCARVLEMTSETHPTFTNIWAQSGSKLYYFDAPFCELALYIYPTCTGFGTEYKRKTHSRGNTSFGEATP